MRKLILLPALSAILVLSFIKLLSAAGFNGGAEIKPSNGVAVIELFTSQSCSSCPPADRLLSSVADNTDIIALGFHVTYWDHLHWKDTLSREFATKRQHAIANHRKSRRVYTPQMVVNGADEFVGSNKRTLTNALNNAHKITAIAVKQNTDYLNITLPNRPKNQYTLWVAGIKDKHTQSIPSGENRGKTINYTNAVLEFKSAGSWDGSSDNRNISITPIDSIDRYVVFAQENSYGKIIAAGRSN